MPAPVSASRSFQKDRGLIADSDSGSGVNYTNYQALKAGTFDMARGQYTIRVTRVDGVDTPQKNSYNYAVQLNQGTTFTQDYTTTEQAFDPSSDDPYGLSNTGNDPGSILSDAMGRCLQFRLQPARDRHFGDQQAPRFHLQHFGLTRGIVMTGQTYEQPLRIFIGYDHRQAVSYKRAAVQHFPALLEAGVHLAAVPADIADDANWSDALHLQPLPGALAERFPGLVDVSRHRLSLPRRCGRAFSL